MSSKFTSLIAHARSRDEGAATSTPVAISDAAPASDAPPAAPRKAAPHKAAPRRRSVRPASKPLPALDGGETLLQSQAAGKPRGRPRGKRSHPDFEQITAYIGKQTYRDTKIALLQEGENRQFSELVEHLLREWLENR